MTAASSAFCPTPPSELVMLGEPLRQALPPGGEMHMSAGSMRAGTCSLPVRSLRTRYVLDFFMDIGSEYDPAGSSPSSRASYARTAAGPLTCTDRACAPCTGRCTVVAPLPITVTR